jgi:hypothetical protein
MPDCRWYSCSLRLLTITYTDKKERHISCNYFFFANIEIINIFHAWFSRMTPHDLVLLAYPHDIRPHCEHDISPTKLRTQTYKISYHSCERCFGSRAYICSPYLNCILNTFEKFQNISKNMLCLHLHIPCAQKYISWKPIFCAECLKIEKTGAQIRISVRYLRLSFLHRPWKMLFFMKNYTITYNVEIYMWIFFGTS